MIVKIGDSYYDSNKEPIMLVLGVFEKQHISLMGEQKLYCSFPETYELDKVRKFMQVPEGILDAVNYNDYQEAQKEINRRK